MALRDPQKLDGRSCHGVSKATTGNADSGIVLNIGRQLGLRHSEAPTEFRAGNGDPDPVRRADVRRLT
jgi:hypothetical protein